MTEPELAEPTSSDEELSPGSHLCTSCGLCCEGALHSNALLDEDEISDARALGLPVREDSERPLFSLPCPKLENSCCGIYGSRPQVCARYKSQLLQDLEHGRVDLDEALARVQTARHLLEQLREVMPDGMTMHETRVLAVQSAEPPAGAEGLQRLILKLRTTALQVYIDKFFRNSRDIKQLQLTTMTGTAEGIEKR